jgi:hypothetical protein
MILQPDHWGLLRPCATKEKTNRLIGKTSEVQALPDLDANPNSVVIQHIRLENEGWERDTTVDKPVD